jgi:hypothetical protein
MGQIILLIFRNNREPASAWSPDDLGLHNLVPFLYYRAELALGIGFPPCRALEDTHKIGFDLSIEIIPLTHVPG